MKELFKITIPLKPVSLNKWYAGNQHWSKRHSEKKKWNNYFELIKKQIPVIQKDQYPVVLEVKVFFKDKRKRDVDNFGSTAAKLSCDSLVKIGVIEDDSYKFISKHIYSIHSEPWTEDCVELTIYKDEFKLT